MMLSKDARRQLNKALLPATVLEQKYKGELKGIYHPSSAILNVYPPDVEPSILGDTVIGICGDSHGCEDPSSEYDFVVCCDPDELRVTFKGEPFEVSTYDLVQNVFSRNSGLLESEQMLESSVVIFGCGSVGSLISLELARAGVGNFLLVDNDILEYHNICRHQCGIHDIGEYKVDALKRRILDINPKAHVEAYASLAEYVPKETWDEWVGEKSSLCIGCADNREADVYVNDLCLLYDAPFMSIGFWERAFAGEVFYWLPNKGTACYKCALGDGSLGERNSMSRRLYTTQEDAVEINFEPGIAVDIDFVTTVGAKVAIDILNRNNSGFTQRLLPTLEQYTLVCNTNNPSIGGEMAEIFSYPLQVTTSLKVVAKPGCECSLEGDRNA